MNAEAVVCVVADRLREILASCPRCGGLDGVTVVFTAHRMLNAEANPRWPAPHIDPVSAGRGTAREPCLMCWRIRQVVELAEDYP